MQVAKGTGVLEAGERGSGAGGHVETHLLPTRRRLCQHRTGASASSRSIGGEGKKTASWCEKASWVGMVCVSERERERVRERERASEREKARHWGAIVSRAEQREQHHDRPGWCEIERQPEWQGLGF
eukprot:3842942-Rhodomonas_salina.3